MNKTNNKQTMKQLSQAGKETVNLYRDVQIDLPTRKDKDANGTKIGDGCGDSTRPPPAARREADRRAPWGGLVNPRLR